MQYLHFVRLSISPFSSEASKLRRLIPYLTSKAAGTTIVTKSPPAPKKGPSPLLHLHMDITSPNAAGKHLESLQVVYTDGTELKLDLDQLPNVQTILDRVDRVRLFSLFSIVLPSLLPELTFPVFSCGVVFSACKDAEVEGRSSADLGNS